MSGSKFVYVTYIRAGIEKVWDALQNPEFTKQYWFGVTLDCTWKKGASWKMVFPDGRIADAGEILEIDPPKQVVIKWRNEFRPELKAEGYTRCTMDLVEEDGAVKLTITHESEVPNAKTITAVSGGWPKILSSLKSLLETGAPLARPKD